MKAALTDLPPDAVALIYAAVQSSTKGSTTVVEVADRVAAARQLFEKVCSETVSMADEVIGDGS